MKPYNKPGLKKGKVEVIPVICKKAKCNSSSTHTSMFLEEEQTLKKVS